MTQMLRRRMTAKPVAEMPTDPRIPVRGGWGVWQVRSVTQGYSHLATGEGDMPRDTRTVTSPPLGR